MHCFFSVVLKVLNNPKMHLMKRRKIIDGNMMTGYHDNEVSASALYTNIGHAETKIICSHGKGPSRCVAVAVEYANIKQHYIK